jgi:hypothetical protein
MLYYTVSVNDFSVLEVNLFLFSFSSEIYEKFTVEVSSYSA